MHNRSEQRRARSFRYSEGLNRSSPGFGVLSLACWLTVTLLALIDAGAATRYVNAANPKPVSPYTTWAGAASNIQQAVDVANVGDVVLVTNGIYQTGGRAGPGTLMNRVAVLTRQVQVRSVNGPEVTIIKGSQAPWSTNGTGAVRCVYLDEWAVLSGFTLTNGATLTSGDLTKDQSGGGVWCLPSAVVSNCIIVGNAANVRGGGAVFGSLTACTLAGNSSRRGGGAAYVSATNCHLVGNWVGEGGGAYAGTLTNCTFLGNWSTTNGGAACAATLDHCALRQNSATNRGGGAYSADLRFCLLQSNSGTAGGGAFYGTLTDCTVVSNIATRFQGGGAAFTTGLRCTFAANAARWGGGASFGSYTNCLFTANTAETGGGVDNASSLNNCTLTGNSAQTVGGASYCSLYNCILYDNVASLSAGSGGAANANHDSCTLDFCCTTPLPTNSITCFTNAPRFADPAAADFHLQATSPCINAGVNRFVTTSTDLDGQPRIVRETVDVGAYEFPAPASALSHAWLQQFGLPTDGSADTADPDGDGASNYSEWIAGTDPTNALSAFRLFAPINSLLFPGSWTLTWSSAEGRTYSVEIATNSLEVLVFSRLQGGIPGLPGSTSFTGTNAPGFDRCLFRVGVER